MMNNWGSRAFFVGNFFFANFIGQISTIFSNKYLYLGLYCEIIVNSILLDNHKFGLNKK